MKGLAITSKGIEHIAALEVKEMLGKDSTLYDGCITFDVSAIEQLITFTYMTQSSERVLLLLDHIELGKIDSLNSLDFKKWVDKKTFRITVDHIDSDHDLVVEEIIEQVAEIILSKTKAKVDLDHPDIVFYVYISKKNVFFGIDLCRFELQKRQYRIFPHQAALRSTLGYALVRIAGYKKNLTLLDPFCGSGTIPIEAVLYALKFPVNYFNKDKFIFHTLGKFDSFLATIDKKIIKEDVNIYGYDSFMGCVIGARKNAKIAGIDKFIAFSRVEISWLDTKFKKGSVDLIVTQPPEPSKTKNDKDIEKLYKDFFYQAEYILKKKGKIVTITRNNLLLKKHAEPFAFHLKEELSVFSGKQEMVISVFVHNNSKHNS